jgi:putative peptidoglycan lipid II flippase
MVTSEHPEPEVADAHWQRRESLQPHSGAGLARATTKIGALALISPVSGLALEIVLARWYGASETIDAYRAAFTLLTLASQLFAGTMLVHSLVPVVVHYRTSRRTADGWLVALWSGVGLALAAAVFAVWAWSRPDSLVELLAPGLGGAGRHDAGLLVRYFSVAFVALACAGAMNALLQANSIFWPGVISQSFNNLIVIALLVTALAAPGAHALAIGNLVGFAAMAALLAGCLARLARNAGLSVAAIRKLPPSEGIARAARLGLPQLATVFLPAAAFLVPQRALSRMASGTLSLCGYAGKPLMFVAMLGNALAMAAFPGIAERAAARDRVELSRLVTEGLRLGLFITVALAATVFAVREPLVKVLFGGGLMGSADEADIAHYLAILLLGTPAATLTTILGLACAAKHNTKPGAVATLCSAACLVGLTPWLGARLGASGVMLSISAASWAGGMWMLSYEGRRLGLLDRSALAAFSVRLALMASAIVLAGAAVRAATQFGSASGWFELALVLVACVAASWLACSRLRIDEFFNLAGVIRSHLYTARALAGFAVTRVRA